MFQFEIRHMGQHCKYINVVAYGVNMRAGLRNARSIIDEYVCNEWQGGWARLNSTFGKTDSPIGIKNIN